MPSLTIFHPVDGASVASGQSVIVSGQATDRGGAEPVMIESVTVQVDGGPPTRATLQRLHAPSQTLVAFSASVGVTGVEGAHVITVVATNDSGLRATKAVTVYLGPSLAIDAPAVRIEIQAPFQVDPADPVVVGLLSRFQRGLGSISSTLADAGLILAGPNIVMGQDEFGVPVVRVGLWAERSGIALLPPAPPQFPLPRLADATAEAGFAQVPVQQLPHRTGFTDFPFAVSIELSALQALVDASVAAADNDQVDSVSVTVAPPDTVSTTIHGSGLDGLVPATVTITEHLAVAPVAGSNPPATAPVVTHDVSTSVGDVLEWIIGTVIVPIGAALLVGWHDLSTAADAAAQGGSVATLLAADFPPSVPLHNDAVPGADLAFDFPVLLPGWTSYGVQSAGIVGAGDAMVLARDQGMTQMSITGPDFLSLASGELDVTQEFTVALTNLAPDGDELTWELRSLVDGSTRTATAPVGDFSQSASLNVDFTVPLHAAPGNYHFLISVSATETCGTDPSKTLSAAASKQVTVRKPAHPGHPSTQLDHPGPGETE